MHSTGSALYTILERVNALLDNPDLEAKYSDDWTLRHKIMPAWVDVMGRVNMMRDNPVLLRYSLSIVEDQEYYQLPPCIQEIWRVAELNDDGVVISDWRPEGEFSPHGPGWTIEGNVLALRPYPQDDTSDMAVWYVSNGDVGPHYATDGSVLTSTTVTLSSAPTLGWLDKRANAYGGMMLRVFGASLTEEVLIESYVPSTRVVTLRRPLTATGTITYEVVPMAMSQALWDAISYAAALKFAPVVRATGDLYRMLVDGYNSALKTLCDNLANMNVRKGKYYDKLTIDNPLLSQWDNWIW